jgi:hypothetical protein
MPPLYRRLAPVTSPADTAAAAFRQRQAFASKQVGAGALTAGDAEARLRPWLHIAAIAGSELPELTEHATVIFPSERAGQTVRVPLAVSLPLTRGERDTALTELARARDAALDEFDTHPAAAKIEVTRALCRLADHLGAPAWRPRQMKDAA